MKCLLPAFLMVCALAAFVPGLKSAGEKPGVIAAVAPATYPAIARTANAHGEVIVEVQIDRQGNVLSAKTISGHPLLVKVSEEAAKEWKFTSQQGDKSERTVQLTFGYQSVYQGQKPKSEFTTIFMPPYKVEVQAHPINIS